MIDRRRLFRGMLDGGTVAVGLPLLGIFLDGNGEALASGRPMPLRFGTWFWGCGMQNKVFIPKTVGPNFDLPEEMAALKNVKNDINVLTGFSVIKDDAPNLCHYTGWVGLRGGGAPMGRDDLPGESIDVTIAKKVGGFTRFRSLDATATASPRDAFSFNGSNAFNTPEVSPSALYTRIFGDEFQDPNGKTFTPNPRTMVRRSVLSGVLDRTKAFQAGLGAEDKARLDQYFTGLREVENQIEHQLIKPEPAEACRVPGKPKAGYDVSLDADAVALRHKLITDLMVMALACDQTRVFNIVYSGSFAATTKIGVEKPHHASTHEELVDAQLGYQADSSWFTRQAMENWAYLVNALASVKEGDRRLLDNTVVFAHSDTEYARVHSLEGVPMFTAGRAGGRLKTGLHIAGGGQPGTQLGYTLLRTMGVDAPNWGMKSNRTSKAIGEIVA